MAAEPVQGARRELKTRQAGWAMQLAAWMGGKGVTPNSISVLSMVFALLGAVCFINLPTAPCKWGGTLLWLGAAACIQLRLLCNLLDGMIAIEGGKKSITGGLYNEVPDRVADALFLAAAGYSSAGLTLANLGGLHDPRAFEGVVCCGATLAPLLDLPLGWAAVTLAMITAYIRVLGGTLTGTQSFTGPMAKQHRMAVLTLGCLLSIAELWMRKDNAPASVVMWASLLVIVIGSVWTCVRRLGIITRELHALQSKAD